ncbi:hypothetical protein MRX96_050022 [Rhipicephalus microplus]
MDDKRSIHLHGEQERVTGLFRGAATEAHKSGAPGCCRFIAVADVDEDEICDVCRIHTSSGGGRSLIGQNVGVGGALGTRTALVSSHRGSRAAGPSVAAPSEAEESRWMTSVAYTCMANRERVTGLFRGAAT